MKIFIKTTTIGCYHRSV